MQSVIASLGTDDDSIKLKFIATHVSTLHGVIDGTIVRTGSNSYAVVRNGILNDAKPSDIPENFLTVFEFLETTSEHLKYPYSITLENAENGAKKTN